jgi:ferric-dicitrate binding protein FerR (iron transport regulator)
MSLPDDRLEPLLSTALRQPPLSGESLERMRAAVEREWQAQRLHTRQTRTRKWAGALAASVAVVAVLLWWTQGQSTEIAGIVDPTMAQGLVVTGPGPFASASNSQTRLRVGQSVEARANTAIRLSNGGSLRMKAGSSLSFVAIGEARLRRGSVYLDFNPTQRSASLAVRTPLGVVQHLGTQYEIALQPAQLRVRVREGTVQVHGAVVAQAEAGEELTIDPANRLQRRAIIRYGNEWAWAESVASSDFDAEGKNLRQLLLWVARETGRRLDFSNARVEGMASDTVLHGSIRGLPPDVALRAMVATTSLAADVRDEVITVRAASPNPAPVP